MCTAICSPAVAQRCPFYSQEPRAKSSFSRLIWPPVLQMCSEPTVSRSSAGRAASGRRQCFAPCLLHTCTHPLGVPLFAGNVVSRRPRRTAAHGDGGQGGGRAVRPRRRRGCFEIAGDSPCDRSCDAHHGSWSPMLGPSPPPTAPPLATLALPSPLSLHPLHPPLPSTPPTLVRQSPRASRRDLASRNAVLKGELCDALNL